MEDNLINAATLSQDEFDQAEALLISLLRESYPSLDLRRGTALRDLLVRPEAAIYALESRRNDELRRNRSLVDMLANPKEDDTDAINAVLSNFNTALRPGRKAVGLIKIQVRDLGVYRLEAGRTFTSSDDSVFASANAVEARAADSTLRGPDDDGFFYFTTQVEALEAGDTSVSAGSAFKLTNPFGGFVAAVAYADFLPGSAPETPAEAVARLPQTVATRGLSTRAAIAATLTDPHMADFAPYVRALSIQGIGDPAQWRDRRNAYGVPVGGKVDVYARTFTGLPVRTLIKKGYKIGNGSYSIRLEAADAPGYYAIKSITSAGTVLLPAGLAGGFFSVGSYPTQVTPFRALSDLPPHRLSAADSDLGTIYRGAVIVVSGVQEDTEAVRDFKVEVYCAPALDLIQKYVDRPDVRNVSSDILIRSPFICFVGLRLPVVVAPGASLDVPALRKALVAAINSKGFDTVLTLSEIASVAHTFPITSIDTTQGRRGGFEMLGTVIDADDRRHTITGHTLDVGSVAPRDGLLRRCTCVFATGEDYISIEARHI